MNRSYDRAKAFPASEVTRTLWGEAFHVDFSHDLEWGIFARGQYECHIRDVILAHVIQGATCIDVGANIGVHTVPLARAVGPHGVVVAIEADPRLADRLESNLALNEVANVTVVRAAAAAVGGMTLQLNTTPPYSRSHAQASLIAHTHLTGATIAVPTVTLDDLAFGRIVLIKIDVEGAEFEVLQGAARTLIRDKPALVFEFNRTYSKHPFSAFRDLLLSCGYRSLWEVPVPAGRIILRTRPLINLAARLPAQENANVLALPS